MSMVDEIMGRAICAKSFFFNVDAVNVAISW